jgi:hypothetical protein
MNEDQKNRNENVKRKNSKSEERNENISQEKVAEHPEPTNQTSDIAKSEIQNMEVHHHPDLHHRKKHWNEYFLEFLMIFLAVTLGFFAESYREYLADRNKEKEIIAVLQNDLKKDIATLNQLIAYIPVYNSWVDSVHNYIDSMPLKGNERKISKAIFNATFWNVYVPPEIALDLLKSSGNLINNKKTKTEILKYNTVLNDYIKYSEFIIGAEHYVDTSMTLLIDRKVLRKFGVELGLNIRTRGYDAFLNNSDIPDTVIFKTYNKSAFLNFTQKLDQMDFLLSDMLISYKIILEEDTTLLRVLKGEYHLKDE